MACIGCGLALNGDGKGRIDIDTEGGLECQGTGDGGTSNTANNGLAIKVNGTAGNSLQVDSNGVFVPPQYRFETNGDTWLGGALTDPGFGIGGGTYTTPAASFVLSNTTNYGKAWFYQAAGYYGPPTSASDAPFWIELATSEGGGYSVPSAQYLAGGDIYTPLTMLPQLVVVPANSSVTLSAKLVIYRGNYSSIRVSIIAWGGYY